MSEKLDDLCVLPSVGPETQGILRDHGYDSYAVLAQATPFELHRECDIGLSNTAGIINTAMDCLDCCCPKCNGGDISPLWGGYPGPLTEAQKSANDVFCGECLWVGLFDVVLASSEIAARA